MVNKILPDATVDDTTDATSVDERRKPEAITLQLAAGDTALR